MKRYYYLSIVCTTILFVVSFVSSEVLEYEPVYIASLVGVGVALTTSVVLAIFANPLLATIVRSALTLVAGLVLFTFFYGYASLMAPALFGRFRTEDIVAALVIMIFYFAAIASLHLFLAGLFSFLGRGAIRVLGLRA